MEQFTAVVADDESLAREGLAARLTESGKVSVVAACGDGKSALHCIQQLQPDVVFLDIQMPGLSGIELVDYLQLQGGKLPVIVFITAYAEFAVSAFECQAADYLLKPYSDDRLQLALERSCQVLEARDAMYREQQLDRLLTSKTGKSLDGFIASLEVAPNSSVEQLQGTISVKSGSEWLRIQLDDIDWIESAGDYMCVHTNKDTHIIRKTLKQLEHELDPQRFVRLNRSAIVNLRRVIRLSPNSNGEYLATLDSGKQIKVSRKYKFNLDELNSH